MGIKQVTNNLTTNQNMYLSEWLNPTQSPGSIPEIPLSLIIIYHNNTQ